MNVYNKHEFIEEITVFIGINDQNSPRWTRKFGKTILELEEIWKCYIDSF